MIIVLTNGSYSDYGIVDLWEIDTIAFAAILAKCEEFFVDMHKAMRHPWPEGAAHMQAVRDKYGATDHQSLAEKMLAEAGGKKLEYKELHTS